MKANHTIKFIAFTTALGVLLTGCGGGPESSGTNNLSRTTSPTTSSIIPLVNPVTSGGSGTIASGNDQISDVAVAVNSLNAKMDKTLAAAESASKSSKKNSNLIAWTLGISAAVAAGMLLKNMNIGIKSKSLTKGLLGDDSAINKQNIDNAAGETQKVVGAQIGKHDTDSKDGMRAIQNATTQNGRKIDETKTLAGLDALVDVSTLLEGRNNHQETRDNIDKVGIKVKTSQVQAKQDAQVTQGKVDEVGSKIDTFGNKVLTKVEEDRISLNKRIDETQKNIDTNKQVSDATMNTLVTEINEYNKAAKKELDEKLAKKASAEEVKKSTDAQAELNKKWEALQKSVADLKSVAQNKPDSGPAAGSGQITSPNASKGQASSTTPGGTPANQFPTEGSSTNKPSGPVIQGQVGAGF